MVRASDALVAVGGGYGTLSEVALALKARRPVIGLDSWDIPGVVKAWPRPRTRPPPPRRRFLTRPVPPASQSDTPYLDALRAYAARDPGRFHVPGHKGGPGADPALREALGPAALALDIPALTYGIDVGAEPTPFEEAQRLAAEAWGARRAWFLVNGASQGNHVALLTLAHRGRVGDRPAQRALEHRSTRSCSPVCGRRSWRRSSTPSCTSPTA